jgi:hypothetical protein
VIAIVEAQRAGLLAREHRAPDLVAGTIVGIVALPLAPAFAIALLGAIARIATNIRNGATSPIAGIVHCGFPVLVLRLLAPIVAHVPFAALRRRPTRVRTPPRRAATVRAWPRRPYRTSSRPGDPSRSCPASVAWSRRTPAA